MSAAALRLNRSMQCTAWAAADTELFVGRFMHSHEGCIWITVANLSCAFCADVLHAVHWYVGHELSQHCESMITSMQARDTVSMTG